MNDEVIVQAFNAVFDEIVMSEDFPAGRPLLAHYTSLGSLEKNLDTNEIWFSNPLLMNDLEEVRFGVLRGASIVRESAQLVEACGTTARAELFRNEFDHWSQRLRRSMPSIHMYSAFQNTNQPTLTESFRCGGGMEATEMERDCVRYEADRGR